MDFNEHLINIQDDYNISIGTQYIDREISKENSNISEALSEREIEIYNSIKFDKRKRDWLAGRLAAKKAFIDYCKKNTGFKNTNITVLNNCNKAPYIFEYPELDISITHSNDLAIAAISNSLIGIDLEKISSGNPLIIKYFFSENESNLLKKESLHNDKVSESIIRIWTRKEAVAKYLKLGMKINFKLLDTVNNFISFDRDSEKLVRIFSYKMGDYYLSIAV